jgi:hypothetical protein
MQTRAVSVACVWSASGGERGVKRGAPLRLVYCRSEENFEPWCDNDPEHNINLESMVWSVAALRPSGPLDQILWTALGVLLVAACGVALAMWAMHTATGRAYDEMRKAGILGRCVSATSAHAAAAGATPEEGGDMTPEQQQRVGQEVGQVLEGVLGGMTRTYTVDEVDVAVAAASTGPSVLVLHAIRGCPNCVFMYPEWSRLQAWQEAGDARLRGIVLQKVDCTVPSSKVVDAWVAAKGLTQFPLLILHTAVGSAVYEGERSATAIVAWLSEMAADRHAATESETPAAATESETPETSEALNSKTDKS